ncbi:MAG: (Fe-S)-binding protein, partial [Planctomycetaceae bacterium]
MSSADLPASAGTTSPSPTAPSVTGRIGSGIDYNLFLDCVHCGLCTSACPTYLETGNENDSPRGRIYLMRAVADGRMELTPPVRNHLDLCLDCRSCETACPSGVNYGRLIEPFRIETLQAERANGRDQTRGWFQRLFLFGLFPYPHRLKWMLAPARLLQNLGWDRLLDGPLLRVLPKPLQRLTQQLPRLSAPSPKFPRVLPARGKRRARVGLFTGCVAEAMFGQTHWATARVLQENGCEVVIPNTQVCCGAIHYHSGLVAPAAAFAATNARAFPLNDLDAVIVNVAGCGAMMKDYAHLADQLSGGDDQLSTTLQLLADKSRDVAEFLVELGPVAPQGKVPVRATYHDACHLVHAQSVATQPRDLLEMIPGLELIPLPESTICCGAAGSYNLTEPEMSERLAQRKI